MYFHLQKITFCATGWIAFRILFNAPWRALSDGSDGAYVSHAKKKGVENTVFYLNYSTYEGEPARLYRTPAEIGRDIVMIKDRINKTREMLNIRGLLTDIAAELSHSCFF